MKPIENFRACGGKSDEYTDRTKREEAYNVLLQMMRETIPDADLNFMKAKNEVDVMMMIIIFDLRVCNQLRHCYCYLPLIHLELKRRTFETEFPEQKLDTS